MTICFLVKLKMRVLQIQFYGKLVSEGSNFTRKMRNIFPLFIPWDILIVKTNSWPRIYHFFLVERKDVEYKMTYFYSSF